MVTTIMASQLCGHTLAAAHHATARRPASSSAPRDAGRAGLYCDHDDPLAILAAPRLRDRTHSPSIRLQPMDGRVLESFVKPGIQSPRDKSWRGWTKTNCVGVSNRLKPNTKPRPKTRYRHGQQIVRQHARSSTRNCNRSLCASMPLKPTWNV